MATMKYYYYKKSAFILAIALNVGICYGIETDQQAFKKIVTIKKSFFKTNNQQQIKDLNYLASMMILYAAYYTASILKDQYSEIHRTLFTALDKPQLTPTKQERQAFRYAIESLVAQKDRPTNEQEVNQELLTIDNNYKQVIKALNALHIPHDFPEYISTKTLAQYAQFKKANNTLLPYKNAFEELIILPKNPSPQDIIDLKALAATIIISFVGAESAMAGDVAATFGPLQSVAQDSEKVNMALAYVFAPLLAESNSNEQALAIIRNNYARVINALNNQSIEHNFPSTLSLEKIKKIVIKNKGKQ